MSEPWNDEKILSALSKDKRITLKVDELISSMKKPYSVLLLSKPEYFNTVKNYVLQKSFSEKNVVVFISLNTAYKKFEDEFKPSSEFFFIDMFSQPANSERNVFYIGSGSGLSDCNEALDKIFEETKGKTRIVVLDSLPTLLVYNDEASVKKFVHLLVSKVSSANSSGIILGLSGAQNSSSAQAISQFVDQTIEV